ncbi:MAG TPA: pyridoxamine 5'-phosphate oxidase family protein [Pseudonocardiaceae bacterium]|nr:pyridoxamine 5'-phosphate oxidase family protein [Pseudonocardiaceae bacterium]
MTTTAELAVIDSHEQLRDLLGEASDNAKRKKITIIEEHARTIIEHSPLVLLATSAADGTCDVSPRGDPAGSVLILDEHTLVLAERPGNRLADSLTNLIDNPRAGLLFVVPGMNESLRVNGRVTLVSDAPFFERLVVRGKRPRLAIMLHVEDLYLHCAKAFVRSSLWDPATWPERTEIPTMGRMMKDQLALATSAEELDAYLDNSSATKLY